MHGHYDAADLDFHCEQHYEAAAYSDSHCEQHYQATRMTRQRMRLYTGERTRSSELTGDFVENSDSGVYNVLHIFILTMMLAIRGQI